MGDRSAWEGYVMTGIKDGVYAQVAGLVGRVGQAKNGPYLVVEVQRDGAQYPDRVTVWGLDGVEGERVAVKGWLSWRKSERDGKTFVDVSLNRPEVVTREAAAPVSVTADSPF